MCPHTSLKVVTTSYPPLIPIDASIDQLDYLIMAEYMQNTMTHPLSQVNMDALETQKFELPIGMVQRSNSTKSTRSDKSICSTSSSVDSSVANSPIETPSTTTPSSNTTPPPPDFVVLSLWPHATPLPNRLLRRRLRRPLPNHQSPAPAQLLEIHKPGPRRSHKRPHRVPRRKGLFLLITPRPPAPLRPNRRPQRLQSPPRLPRPHNNHPRRPRHRLRHVPRPQRL